MDYCLAIAAFQKAELHGQGLVPAALFGPQPFFLENEVEWGRSHPSNLLLPVCFQHAQFCSIFTAHHRYYTVFNIYYSQVLVNGWLLFLISEPFEFLPFCLYLHAFQLKIVWEHIRKFGLIAFLFRSQFMTIYTMSSLIIAFDHKEMPLGWIGRSQRFWTLMFLKRIDRKALRVTWYIGITF